MTENADIRRFEASSDLPAAAMPALEAPNMWEALQLRIARRADELARNASPLLRRGSGRLLWAKAEAEILGHGSVIAIWNLLHLAARLSRGPGRSIAAATGPAARGQFHGADTAISR